MDWAAHGFQTGRVVLPGLEIEVDLAPNQWFRYDGFRLNLNSHRKQLEREFKIQIPKISGGLLSSILRGYIPGGFTYDLKTNGSNPSQGNIVIGRNLVIPLPALNLFLIGHESTHALINYGQKNLLLDALKQEGFGLDPFENYVDQEEICDVGGILALYRKRMESKTPHNRQYLLDDLLTSRR